MERRFSSLFLIIVVALAACGTSPAAPPLTLPPTTAPTAVAAISQGQSLFAINCGECHGKDGTGTDEAPAVLGHTVTQVRKQVREPEGDMKAIPADKLSDADLAIIADYIAGLGGKDAHPAIKPGDEERAHLKAAYEAIKDHEKMDRKTAIAHLEQAIALAQDPATDVYKDLVEDIKIGKAGNARHELAELLGMEGMGEMK